MQANPCFRRRALAAVLLALLGGSAIAAPLRLDDGVRATFAPRVNFAATQAQPEFDQFIVNFTPDSAPERDARVRLGAFERAAAARGSYFRFEYVRPLAAGGHVVRLRDVRADRSLSVDPAEAQALMVELARDPDVTYVEPDIRLNHFFTPNDPLYPQQWAYFSDTAGINLAGGWQYANGTGVTVAVIDTGIVPHSDLNANVVGGYDFISDAATARDGDGRDPNPNDEGDWWANSECGPSVPPAEPSSWHGTHVAGIIAALTNNNNAVAGVAYGAKVVPIRVLGKCGGSLSDISDAITWAAGGSVAGVPANPNPAKVINMSLGGQASCGVAMQNAINSAVNAGTVVVAAAGNSSADVKNFVPAGCNNVVAVAALTSGGKLASFSNFGDKIDVAAPGVGILSTLNAGTSVQGAESTRKYDGTSQAAPQVAGLAAMILSKGPKTPAAVENLLKCQARTVDCAFDSPKSCGWGVIDTLRTMKAVASNLTICAQTADNPLFWPSTFTNDNDYTIPGASMVESPNTVWGRHGNASANMQVTLKIKPLNIFSLISVHDYKIELVAPDGTAYLLFNHLNALPASYAVDVSSEVANGLWKLRVSNTAGGNNGIIDTWTLKFN